MTPLSPKKLSASDSGFALATMCFCFFSIGFTVAMFIAYHIAAAYD